MKRLRGQGGVKGAKEGVKGAKEGVKGARGQREE